MLVEICSWCPRVSNDFLSLFNFHFITFSWLALLLEKTRPLIPFHSFMFYFISPHQIWKTKVTKLWFPALLLYWYFFLIYIGSWEECSPTRTFAIWCCFGIALAKFFLFQRNSILFLIKTVLPFYHLNIIFLLKNNWVFESDFISVAFHLHSNIT